MQKFLFLAVLYVCINFSAARSADLNYTLTLDDVYHHTALVTIETAVEPHHEFIDFAMPAWSPGRYVMYNFSKNVFDVTAVAGDGRPLKVKLLDKQTWRVFVKKAEQLKFSYRVFANTLDGTFSKIDSNGASINGAGIFMYIRHRKDRPIILSVLAPKSWNVISALQRLKQNTYRAVHYDQLIDSPIEMGQLFVYRFEHQNRLHRLVFHQPLDQDLQSKFIADLKRVIDQQWCVFGVDLPYDQYTFFYHLNPQLKHSDGMEHQNSCRVLLRINVGDMAPDANTDAAYDNLIWLTAHEYFHLWNIKRLRPKGLGPFDYTRETYTRSLWIIEGLTSYYAYLSLIRSGIYTKEKFLSELAGRIHRYESDPGRRQRTLEEVSLLTWLFKGQIPKYAETNMDKTTYSYYYKGIIVGMLLDLRLRHLTNNQTSLDNVMNMMYRTFVTEGENAYYLPGTGYEYKDFETVAESVAGQSLNEFFEQSLRSKSDLDYSWLNYVGLTLIRNQPTNAIKILPLEETDPTQRQILKKWLNSACM